MRAFYAKLISIGLAARIQENDPQEYGSEVFSFSLNTTSFIKDEDGENIPYSITASFYEMDLNYYMVEYNGYRVCKVRKDYIDDIINAYGLAKTANCLLSETNKTLFAANAPFLGVGAILFDRMPLRTL